MGKTLWILAILVFFTQVILFMQILLIMSLHSRLAGFETRQERVNNAQLDMILKLEAGNLK